MKRLLSLTLALLLCGVLLCCAVFAEQSYIVDNAGLLTEDEIASLNEQAAIISDRHECAVSVLTVYSLDGKTAEAYAEDYFDENRLGYNGSYDGILLLLAMEDRDYYVTSAGKAEPALTGSRLYTLEDAFLSNLSSGDYYGAFSNYLSQCDYQLTHMDEPIEDDYYGYYDEPSYETERAPSTERTVFGGVIAAVVGFLGSLIPTGTMKSKLNNVAQKQTARNYVRDGSMQLYVQNDRYLRTDTSRVRIESDGPRGYGGGGGSSHVSSGGVSHTGGGGKF